MHSWIRGLTTNVARLEATEDDPLLRPSHVSQSRDQLTSLIERWVSQQRGWSLQHLQRDGEATYLHLVRRTRLFRFVDDIHVVLKSDGAETQIDAESRSRVGKGDLGQNRRNLRELMRGILPS